MPLQKTDILNKEYNKNMCMDVVAMVNRSHQNDTMVIVEAG